MCPWPTVDKAKNAIRIGVTVRLIVPSSGFG